MRREKSPWVQCSAVTTLRLLTPNNILTRGPASNVAGPGKKRGETKKPRKNIISGSKPVLHPIPWGAQEHDCTPLSLCGLWLRAAQEEVSSLILLHVHAGEEVTPVAQMQPQKQVTGVAIKPEHIEAGGWAPRQRKGTRGGLGRAPTVSTSAVDKITRVELSDAKQEV